MLGPFAAFAPILPILSSTYTVLEWSAVIWAPLLFTWAAAVLWRAYVQAKFISALDFIMLEVKLPRDIEKTPLAMELVLQSMYQTSQGTWYDQWVKGKVRVWFSLEMISEEGHVRFFIRTPAKFKKLIESHLYAHYPNIEVKQVEDYIAHAPFLHEKDEWDLWGCEFALTKPDPYPIKTYIDYGLDKTDLEEERKTDPINSSIEFLASFSRDQFVWTQILIQPTKERFPMSGAAFKKQNWKKEGEKIIKELKEKAGGGDEGKGKATKREAEIIHAIQRSLSKLGFDCGIRAIYIARKERFDATMIPGVAGLFRQFSSEDLNGFKPTHTTDFDYPWQDFRGIRLARKKREIFEAFVLRSYFYGPYKHKPFVLNTEELATIFHFPGRVSVTPNFERIESRRAEPPPNLPI